MIALVYLGGLIALVAGIWLLVVAFKTSVWWGLGSLLIGPVALVFVIMHWQVAKKPFLIQLVGVAICAIGILMAPEVKEAMMSTPT